MRAAFGKRLMFGSDQMYWPELIGMAVEAFDSATFLTPAEKQDIFSQNAVRFYRLSDDVVRMAIARTFKHFVPEIRK